MALTRNCLFIKLPLFLVLYLFLSNIYGKEALATSVADCSSDPNIKILFFFDAGAGTPTSFDMGIQVTHLLPDRAVTASYNAVRLEGPPASSQNFDVTTSKVTDGWSAFSFKTLTLQPGTYRFKLTGGSPDAPVDLPCEVTATSEAGPVDCSVGGVSCTTTNNCVDCKPSTDPNKRFICGGESNTCVEVPKTDCSAGNTACSSTSACQDKCQNGSSYTCDEGKCTSSAPPPGTIDCSAETTSCVSSANCSKCKAPTDGTKEYSCDVDSEVCKLTDKPPPPPLPTACLDGPTIDPGPRKLTVEATKIYNTRVTNPVTGGTSIIRNEEPLVIGIAHIASPDVPNAFGFRNSYYDEGKRATYRYAETVLGDYDDDGVKDATLTWNDLPDNPLFIGVFCNDKILDIFGIDWTKATNGAVHIPLTYFSNLNCTSNNYCIRPNLDNRYRKVHEFDPIKFDSKFLWWKPTVSQGTNYLGMFALCRDFFTCLSTGVGTILKVAIGANTIVPNFLARARSHETEGATSLAGCIAGVNLPDGEYPLCSEIKQINEDSSGFNSGKCGRFWLKTHSPASIQDLGEKTISKLGGNIVCTNAGEEITLAEIQPPWPTTGHYKLDSSYFPYYLLSPDDYTYTTSDKAGLVPMVNNLDPDFSCTGYPCTPGKESNGPAEVSATTRNNDASISHAYFAINQSTTPGFSYPGKNVEEDEIGKSESAVTRISLVGRETVCPENRNDKGECLSGGITFGLAAQFDLDYCAANPTDEACKSILNKSEDAYVQPFMPRGTIYGVASQKLCSMLQIPGETEKCKYDAGMVFSAAGGREGQRAAIESAELAVPSSLGKQGSMTSAKEQIARFLRPPSALQGN